MKKKYLIVSALCLAAGVLVGLFLFSLLRHRQQQARIERLPVFAARLLDGTAFSSSALPTSRRTAVLFFSPDCEFCRVELDHIVRRGNKWNDVQWLLVTVADRAAVLDFLMDCPADALPGAHILLDEQGSVFSLFGVTAPPVLHVYDENRRLMHSGKGATSISVINKWLQ